MAYPIVAGYNTSIEAANATTHTINLPTGISNGELLVVFFATDGDNTVGWPNEGTDWILIFEVSDTRDAHLSCAYRIADGNEGTTIDVTTTSSETSAHISFRITGHGAGTNPPEASTGIVNADSNPDPDSLTTSWGADDNLWIVMEGNDDDDLVTAYPTNYGSNQHTLDAGAAGPTIGVATYNYNSTDTQNPGTFTIAASEQWVAGTVVIAPYTPPKLHYRKSDATTDITLYDAENGTWNDSLRLRVGGATIYAQLDSNTSHVNASDLRMRVGGTTYAVLTASGIPS
jgi:hypothetical protein